jgi:uncharacterized protein (TIGR03067 family)
MPADHARVKELFLAVLEMPAANRAAYLDTACAGDTALRQQLEIMLQCQENSGELLPRSPAELLADSGATDADATAALALQPQGPPTGIEGAPTDGAESLSFLEPSDKPGHLGRLGHYKILQVIGKGGFGIVLKGFDERLHRVVAIKVLSPAYAANGSARKRFIREAQTAAAIKNEHVVGIYDVEKEARSPYLAMEMIDGISLQDKLDKLGPLSVKEILRIGVQMAEGLAAAHKQGLVHRDIKPANILLENGVERVKITDFGLARAVDDASVTQSGTVAGTPMYMSPEQAEGLAVDHRSDLFSLGTVLYAMSTGHPPFRATGTLAVLKRVIEDSPRPIREINNEIPDWLCDIIARLHAKKPEDRFQTATEVAELLGQRLADVQAGRAIQDEPSRVSDRADAALTGAASRPVSRHGTPRRRNWRVVSALAGVFVVAVVMGWWRFRPHEEGGKEHDSENPPFVPVFGGPDWRRLSDAQHWQKTGPINPGQGEFWRFPRFSVDTIEQLPRNFHLRMEVTVFRNSEARISFHAKPRDKQSRQLPKVGSFIDLFENASTKQVEARVGAWHAADPDNIEVSGNIGVAKLGQPFYLEIIAQDKRQSIRVNGHEYFGGDYGKLGPMAGILSLEHGGQGQAKMQFRNIEYKDLTPPFDATMAKERHALKGSWVALSGKANGEALPNEFLKALNITFDDEFHLKIADFFESRSEFAVDVNAAPRTIAASVIKSKATLSARGGKVEETASELVSRYRLTSDFRGIYQLEGDGLKLCFPMGGHALPKRFDSHADGNAQFGPLNLVLVRKEPGWVQLFNGKDLTGWKVMGHAGWKAQDGVLIGESNEPKGWLMSDKDYADFELSLEYKMAAGSNSGVFLRAWPEGPISGEQFMEIQLIDDAVTAVPRDRTGAIFSVVAPNPPPSAQVDQWHRLDLRVQGRQVQVTFDDQKILAANLDDHTDSFARFPGLTKTTGRIGLQLYPGHVEFKNIRVKALPPSQ